MLSVTLGMNFPVFGVIFSSSMYGNPHMKAAWSGIFRDAETYNQAIPIEIWQDNQP